MSGFFQSKAAVPALLATLAAGALGYAWYRSSERAKSANAQKNDKYTVVFVLGGPGSGKGTNCTKIVEKFGYTHLSAGDLLRDERNSGSKLAEMINQKIKDGQIVPAEVTVNLLHQAMTKSGSRQFLIDGFPRDPDNLTCWEEKMAPFCDVKFMLYLECPEDIMMARLLERGKTSGRNDDNEDSIRKRFKTYIASTQPIIQKFRSQGKLREVNSNRDMDAVFVDVAKVFA
jgi:UMP-CMP kinase